MSPRYFDSHCHLDASAFDDDAGVDAAITRARAAGVHRMMCIGSGYGLQSASRAIVTAARHPDVWASVGVHPHDAHEWTEETSGILRTMSRNPDVAALGEMGLDFYYDNSPRGVQRAVLVAQSALALELALPIIVHDRDSDGECLRMLAVAGAFDGPGVVWHCYTGSLAYMRQIVEHGGYISIPGIVSFKNAGELRAVAAEVPLDRLLIETDSPFLSPVPFRGRRNEPARVVRVAEVVAELRGMSTEDIGEATWHNASRFYQLPD
jgi:TatD DNase family protein